MQQNGAYIQVNALPLRINRSIHAILVSMKKIIIKIGILAVMLLGLPLFGLLFTDRPITPYLEFPPKTKYVDHEPFSRFAFVLFGLFIVAVATPFLLQFIRRKNHDTKKKSAPSFPFPWWGWAGIALGIIAWILAWSRFPWMGELQGHTFTPLWFAYIITINAFTFRRTGGCLLKNRTAFYISLFPISAAFWWFFEYLNRFVQNWYYVGSHFGPWEYFWYATLPFSTVLPAVLGTREWILSYSWPHKKFRYLWPIPLPHEQLLAWIVLLGAGLGLACIGVRPNYLFPLLWISPLLIIVSLQAIFGEPHVFSDIIHGDWHTVISSAVAALMCGFFWEMWNYYSFAKWEYNIPLVNRFQVFEMPILGYAGYFPFGLECVAVTHMLGLKSTSDGISE